MSDPKVLSQLINDIDNLQASEKIIDNFLVELRQAQWEYKKGMEQFSSWSAGTGAIKMNEWSETFFGELSKKIHRLEDIQMEIVKTMERLQSLMKAEINSGPKW
jgi:hypothetical protein